MALHPAIQFHLQLVRNWKKKIIRFCLLFENFICLVGVYLALRNQFIANNTQINIRSIGQYSDKPNGALQCITDKKPCCYDLSSRHGEWHLPNGTLVPVRGNRSESDLEFYRNRGDNGQVYFNQPTDNNITALTPTGRFCCEVPDATGVTRTLCVLIGKLNVEIISDSNFYTCR